MESVNPFLAEIDDEEQASAFPATDTQRVQPESGNAPSGFLGNVADIGKGIVTGPLKEVENVVQTVHDVANYADNKLFGDRFIDDERDYDFVPEALKPKGGMGKTAQAISAFAAGWFSFGTKIKAATTGSKLVQRIPKAANWIGRAVGGGVTDFVTGDTQSARLADVLLENNIVGGAVVEYLASDLDDTAAEARLKNAAEGFIIGGALDATLNLFRGIKKGLKAGATGGFEASLNARKAVTDENLKAVAKEQSSLTMTREAQKQASRKQAIATVNAKMAEQADNIPDSQMFNSRKYSDATRQALVDLEEPVSKIINKEGRMSMADLADSAWEEVADMTGDAFGTSESLREAQGLAKDLRQRMATSTILFQQKIMPSLASASKAVDDGVEGSVDELKAVTTRVVEWAIEFKRFNQEAGRLVKAGDVLAHIAREDNDKVIKSMLAKPLETATEALKGLSPEEVKVLSNQILGQYKIGGNILMPILGALPEGHGLVKSVVSKDSPAWSLLKHYRYNSMLSSLRGRVRDAISMTTKSVIMPFEKTVSGAFMGFNEGGLRGAAQGAKRGKYYVQGMFQAFSTARKMAGVAFDNGTSILRGGNANKAAQSHDVFKQFTGINALRSDSLAAKTLSTPTRLMASMDEFFGQMHYYAETYERLMHGINTSKVAAAIPDPKEYRAFVDSYIKENMDNMYREVVLANGTIHKGGAVFEQALKAANEVTYQAELGEIGKKFYAFIQSNKATQFMFPFVKTPVNLFKDAFWVRSPYGALFNLRQAIKSQNPEAMSQAVGHLATGTLLWGSTLMLVLNGKITGAGPSNPVAKAALRETGWQPYSYKTDEGFVSLSAFEPFSSALMLLADFGEIYSQLDGAPVDQLGEALLNSTMTFARNRTYLQGFANILDSMERGDKAATFLTNQLATFIPNAFKDIAQSVDPTIYETRGILDTFKARTLPMLSDLTPRYNWLTGDPQIYSHGGGLGAFSPIIQSDEAADLVFEEVGKIKGVRNPERRINGVELSADKYAEYCQLHGKIRIGGKTMYEALRAVVTSRQYDAGRLYVDDPDDYNLDDNRNHALSQVIREYRKRAQAELLRNNPQLRTQMMPGTGSRANVFGAPRNPFGSITSF